MTASCAISRKSTISRLHAIEAGAGPLALCLHGITANGYVFEPLMTALAARAQYGYKNVDGKWRPLAAPQAMRETCMGLREDLTEVLKSIRVPVLLMRGADSRLVSREAWAKTRALRPDLPAVEIAGADHYVPEERPREVAAAVQEFWDSIARRKA